MAHAKGGRRVTLPADYVTQHVQLGYACTVHAAQGQTMHTSHTVLTGTESRQLLYVALTRGRHTNHLYLDTTNGRSGDEAPHIDAIRPPTAIEVLTRVIERDDSAVSANSAHREEHDPAPLLRKACAEYVDALAVAGESVLGPERVAQIQARAEAIVPGVTDCPAWPALNTQLQRLVLNGRDADQMLYLEAGILHHDRIHDLAAVLARRLEATHETGPLPWLPAVPPELGEGDFWKSYFDHRAELIQRHATAIRAAATSWTTDTAPSWAAATLSAPDLTRDLAVQRAAREVADTEPRPAGPPADDILGGRVQRRLDQRATDTGAPASRDEPRVARLAESIHPGITTDPHWPTLALQLQAAHRLAIRPGQVRAIAAERPLPIEQPAAALAYRIIDAIGDRPTPPAEQAPKSTDQRPYDRGPMQTEPDDLLGHKAPSLPNRRPEPIRTPGRDPVSRPGPRR